MILMNLKSKNPLEEVKVSYILFLGNLKTPRL